MAKNKLAGTGAKNSYKHMSAEAIKKKRKYDTAYSATKERKKYRASLNRANRKAGTYGNGDNLDMSHTKSGKLVLESQKSNRARNGRNGKSAIK